MEKSIHGIILDDYKCIKTIRQSIDKNTSVASLVLVIRHCTWAGLGQPAMYLWISHWGYSEHAVESFSHPFAPWLVEMTQEKLFSVCIGNNRGYPQFFFSSVESKEYIEGNVSVIT